MTYIKGTLLRGILALNVLPIKVIGSLCDSVIIQLASVLISVMFAVLLCSIYKTGHLPSKNNLLTTIIIGTLVRLICHIIPPATLNNCVIMCIAAKFTLVDKGLALPQDLSSITNRELRTYSEAMARKSTSLVRRLEAIENNLTTYELKEEYANKIQTLIQVERGKDRIVTHLRGGIASDTITDAKRFVSRMTQVEVNLNSAASSNYNSSSNCNSNNS